MAVNVSISIEFLESLIGLPKNIQDKTISFFEKFIKNPDATGLNTEKIIRVDEKQLYSSRIDRNYRCIIYKEKGNKTDTYHLLWIDDHDNAYRKADLVNKIKTNNLMVRSRNNYERRGLSRTKPAKLFAFVSENELKSLGVTDANLFYIRNVENIEQLEQLKDSFPDIDYAYLKLRATEFDIKEILEYHSSTTNELLKLINQKVLDPALDCHTLDKKTRESVKNTKERIESKKSVTEIIYFYNDALMSIRGKEIKEKLNKAGLKAFEDIEGLVRDFIGKIVL
jgi:mRNA-degrading endonuclease RelE of RelBE toxin-antitoxin system